MTTLSVTYKSQRPHFYSVVYGKDGGEIVTEGKFTREWAESVVMARREEGYKAVMRKLEVA